MRKYNFIQAAAPYLIIWGFLVLAAAILALINHLFAQESQMAANINTDFAINFLIIGWGIAFFFTFIFERLFGKNIKEHPLVQQPVSTSISFALGSLCTFLAIAAL
jgi:hypothetical protein